MYWSISLLEENLLFKLNLQSNDYILTVKVILVLCFIAWCALLNIYNWRNYVFIWYKTINKLYRTAHEINKRTKRMILSCVNSRAISINTRIYRIPIFDYKSFFSNILKSRIIFLIVGLCQYRKGYIFWRTIRILEESVL